MMRRLRPLAAAMVASSAPVAMDVLETVVDPDSVAYTVQRNDTIDRIFRSVGLDMAPLAGASLPDRIPRLPAKGRSFKGVGR